ncbi:MAG TPA: FkbM family methyltransferase [Parvularculaceae bacterium]|nr:FkbM family methyltransferase [Parvularculaceae bacterium]HNS87363.1 FkbM family methyltransferase [Parvularculaceae bacterium]
MLNLKGLGERSAAERAARLDEALKAARGVLHLGAHLGQEAPFYAARNLPVVWVEALPEIYARLAERIKRFPGQRAICALLGDRDGTEVEFNISNNWEGVSSSLFEFGPYASGEKSLWPELNLRMVDRVRLEMTTLDCLLRREAIDAANFDHWTVDLQGAELLALKGAANAVAACRTMLVEVSSERVYNEGVLYDEIESYLSDLGFQRRWPAERTHDEILFARK